MFTRPMAIGSLERACEAANKQRKRQDAILDELKTRVRSLQNPKKTELLDAIEGWKAEAYIVIGQLLGALDALDSPEGQRAGLLLQR